MFMARMNLRPFRESVYRFKTDPEAANVSVAFGAFPDTAYTQNILLVEGFPKVGYRQGVI